MLVLAIEVLAALGTVIAATAALVAAFKANRAAESANESNATLIVVRNELNGRMSQLMALHRDADRQDGYDERADEERERDEQAAIAVNQPAPEE